ncbi:MAG: hypothetical protein KDC80_15760 [Saprospiraceae bacterium]|nr:hypothetical protein [Saprospiraceae bacterium]
MKRHSSSLQHIMVISSVMALLGLNALFCKNQDNPEVETANKRSTLLSTVEEPEVIQIWQGSDCGEYGGDGIWQNIKDFFLDWAKFHPGVSLTNYWEPDQGLVEMTNSLELPDWANRVAIIYNGSYLLYTHRDHHVNTLGASIWPVKTGNTLHWTSVGMLGDKGLDDEFESCIYYTIIAWNSAVIDANTTDLESYVNKSWTITKNRSVTKAVFNYTGDAWPAPEPVAIIPRGYYLSIEGEGMDMHLFQESYEITQNKSTNLFDPPTWQASGLLRDNHSRETVFGAPCSLLHGSGVSVITEPFDWEERTPVHCGFFQSCFNNIELKGVHKDTIEVQVPRDTYAIPMLTGMDLAYSWDDEHFKYGGMWLDDISRDMDAGRLTYTVNSVLEDKNGKPGHYAIPGVTILLLDRSSNPYHPRLELE